MTVDDEAQGTAIGGRYRLLTVIASGGMGTIWEGRDEQLGRLVAVKEVSLDLIPPIQRPEFLQRAVNEGRTTAALADHPNIVTVYDVVIQDGVPWTVLQLVRGRSLAERLQAGPMPEAEAADLARQLLSALGFAHAAGITHRDVKPLNIMLNDGDGRALLTDFGIAKNQDHDSLTRTGVVIGSTPYMAPERHEGYADGPAADLFSLGVTLFEALEGYSPFAKDTRTGTVTAILVKPLPPMEHAGHLAPLIQALTQKNPDDRPTAQQAAAMLGTAIPAPGHAAPSAQALGGQVRFPSTMPANGQTVVAQQPSDEGSAANAASPRRRPRKKRLAIGVSVVVVALGASASGAWMLFHWADKALANCTPSGGFGGGTVDPVTRPIPAIPPGTPHAPTLVAPADESVFTLGQPIELRWAAPSGHAFELALSSNNSDFERYSWKQASGCIFQPTTPGLYAWTLMERPGLKTGLGGPWSETRLIKVVSPGESAVDQFSNSPHPPTLVSPGDRIEVAAGQPVTLTWTTTGRLSKVLLRYPDGTDHSSDWQDGQTYTFTPTTPGQYAWGVWGSNDSTAPGLGHGTSGGSEQRTITVK
ncbi:serine/threonine-protein kinase [Catenulispora subtropica]|uniref:non-specific serine/threonine protein kinase n=1 Tax=Catenulispora subtropica TaxID=450798 RepID=A0ABP5BNW5_9ACTN